MLGCTIGKNCSIGNVSIVGYKMISIGDNVVLEDNVRLKAANNINEKKAGKYSQFLITIEDHVFIGYGSVIDSNKSVIIKNHCMLGPYVFVTDSNHIHHLNDVLFPYLGGKYDEVLINRNCWIGSHSIILPGVTVGENSIIAANSTVIRNIVKNTLNAGTPSTTKRKNG